MYASVHEEILEAQSQGHTNLYLNYRKLSELPEELLTLSRIKKLYLKRNVLKKLVRSVTHVNWEVLWVFFGRHIVLTVCAFALQPADIWKLENLVELWVNLKSNEKIISLIFRSEVPDFHLCHKRDFHCFVFPLQLLAFEQPSSATRWY